MEELARITNNGELDVKESIDTRSSSIDDGLVMHLPLDINANSINCGDVFSWDGDFPETERSTFKTGLMDTIYLESEVYLNSYPSEKYSFLWASGPETQGTSNVYLSVDSSGKVSVYEYAKISNGYHASIQKLELNKWYTVGHLSTPYKTYIIIDGKIDRVIFNEQEYIPDINIVKRESGGRLLDGISRNPRVSSFSPFLIQHEIDIWTQPYTQETKDGVWIGGSRVENFGRDWNLMVWDSKACRFLSNTEFNHYSANRILSSKLVCFDVYADTTAEAQAFVNTINDLESHHVVIIGGSHAPERYTSGMASAIKYCGGSSDKLEWTSRKSYICVGFVGSGEGNAITEVLSNVANNEAHTSCILPTQTQFKGLPIDRGGFNMVTNGTDPSSWSLSNDPNNGYVNHSIIDTEFGIKGMRRVVSSGDYRGTLIRPTYEGYSTIDPNSYYTQSVWAKTNDPGDVDVNLNVQGINSSGSRVDSSNVITINSDEWKLYTHTFKPADVGMTEFISTYKMYLYSKDSNVRTIDVVMPQTQKLDHATWFSNQNKVNSEFKIDVDMGDGDFSFSFDFIPNSDSDNITNGQQMFYIESSTSPNLVFRNYNNAPYFDGNAFDGSSHNVHEEFRSLPNIPCKFVFTKTGNTGVLRAVSQDGQDTTWSIPRDPSTDVGLSNLNFDKLIINGYWGGIFKNISIYDRKLNDLEVEKLLYQNFNINNNGVVKVSSIETRPTKWTLVYDGIATEMASNTFDAEYENFNRWNVEFDQMMLVHKYARDIYTIATTTERAILKENIKFYIHWLFTQSDGSYPQIKFHGLDEVQDVGFTSNNTLFWGYGNSWRRFDSPIFVGGITNPSMYMGATPSSVIKNDWFTFYGDNDYFENSHAEANDFRESGEYELTPREWQSLQIYVRTLPETNELTNMSNDGIKTNGLHTGEVL